MKWWHWLLLIFFPILIIWAIVAPVTANNNSAMAPPAPQGTSGFLNINGLGSLGITGL